MKEYTASALIALVGTYLTSWIGGWDMLIQALIAFMVIDYITGVLAAFKERRINSDTMLWGGVRKLMIFTVIVIAQIFDGLLGFEAPILRTMAIYFYIVREGVSITENSAMLGVPIPDVIKRALEQLKKRTGQKDEDKDKDKKDKSNGEE
jgi:toxin secretion/phage lysis holin